MGVRLQGVIEGSDLADVLEAYETTCDELFGFVLATTRSRPAAEEIVQESFLRLIQERRHGRPPTDPRAWLFRVSANLVRSRYRRESAATRWLARWRREDVAEGPEPRVLRDEQRDRIRTALGSLPMDARVALMLAAEGFSGQEVAGIIGRTEGSTRTLLWRARVALRDVLAEERER